MGLSIEEFIPRHGKLLCVDSDGTAIDTMTVKHKRCLGRSFIEVWGLEEHAQEVQRVWDSVNLYERSRGVNRFLALDIMLERMEGAYLHTGTDALSSYRGWLQKGELSEKGLSAELAENPSPLLQKALRWSREVNERVAALTSADMPPFPHVRETLEAAKDRADIAVVSTSYFSTILEEWDTHGLSGFLSVVTGQECGSKADRIRRLIDMGYSRENVLMLGDAELDRQVAEANGVWFYPILVGHEGESWERLRDDYLPLFLDGGFGRAQKALLRQFADNFTTCHPD